MIMPTGLQCLIALSLTKLKGEALDHETVEKIKKSFGKLNFSLHRDSAKTVDPSSVEQADKYRETVFQLQRRFWN